MRCVTHLLLPLLMLGALSGTAWADEIKVGSYNVESGEADPDTLAARVQESKFDLWGFSEVASDTWAQKFEEAAERAAGSGARFARILGTTGTTHGAPDFLAIVYSEDKFEKVGAHQELHDINDGNHRSPLVVQLKEKATGRQFLFVVNHLARKNKQFRHRQATLLNRWAVRQLVPVIAVGDYNFDWEVQGGETDHDKGFDNLVEDGVFRWIRPAQLVRTQMSGNFDSVLDFVFVSGEAKDWTASSTIIEKSGDEPDDQKKSDHRPITASIKIPPAPGSAPAPSLDTLLARIDALRAELDALRDLVVQLGGR